MSWAQVSSGFGFDSLLLCLPFSNVIATVIS